MNIGNKYSNNSEVQDYKKKITIDGVKFVELKKFVDCGGSFAEIVRAQSGIPNGFDNFEIKQINYSQIVSGAIKAGHYHLNQDDLWFVPPSSRVLVGLKDIREDSDTYENVLRIVMGDGKPGLLFIPRGVLHGVANLWTANSDLIYMVNQNFNPDDADEHRLPPEEFGDHFWEISKG